MLTKLILTASARPATLANKTLRLLNLSATAFIDRSIDLPGYSKNLPA